MDPKVMKQIHHKISQDPYARFLGIELLELREGYSKLAMTVGDHMVNFHGMPHGGATYSLADAAFAAASNSRGEVVVAVHVNISYLRAVTPGTRLVAEAREEARGGRITLYHLTVTTRDGDLVAVAQGLGYRKRQTFVQAEGLKSGEEG